jgi:CubicO group peptidase (beta-lactamase class C family)
MVFTSEALSTDRARGFRSMDQIFPYHRVARGGAIAELPRAPRKLAVGYDFNGDSHTLVELLRRTGTEGFLVIKGGAIVDERYFSGADDHSRFASWSMAKSVTSTLDRYRPRRREESQRR